MNISYILLLPNDILKQIPPSYRIWKLLQMTCRDINNRLGDYHTARDISLQCRNGEELSYNIFVDRMIYDMTDDSSSGDRWYEMYSSCGQFEIIADWYDNRFDIYNAGINDEHQSIKRCGQNNTYACIRIDNIWYKKAYKDCDITLLLAFIYNELPKLFSKIKIIRYVDSRDIIRP